MAHTIVKTFTLQATPEQVYDALMDSALHTRLTGSRAEIGSQVGDRFSAYNGYITGENLELEPGKKIVQTWHASDWPAGHVSTILFEFHTVKNGTRVSFRHANIPAKHLGAIKKGWEEYYWEPLKAMFNKGTSRVKRATSGEQPRS